MLQGSSVRQKQKGASAAPYLEGAGDAFGADLFVGMPAIGSRLEAGS